LTTTAHVPSEVEAYVARVRAALADVPDEERNDLLAEVEASLYETASESGGSVAARLGPPEEFAAELRSAAGLHAPAARSAPARERIERLLADPRTKSASRLLRELAPIWWVVRGYVAVAALALAAGTSWSTSHGAVPRTGNAKLGAAAILLAVIASVALGLWSRHRNDGRLPMALLNLVLLAATVPVAIHLSHDNAAPVAAPVVIQTEIVRGLAYDGAPLSNVFPYSRDGRLLHDVFLYSGSGKPLNVSTTVYDPQRRILKTRAGRSVFNAFPLRYYQPGTKVVLHPNAGPRVRVPRVVTPPLRARR
jgi:hypothetical protein